MENNFSTNYMNFYRKIKFCFYVPREMAADKFNYLKNILFIHFKMSIGKWFKMIFFV